MTTDEKTPEPAASPANEPSATGTGSESTDFLRPLDADQTVAPTWEGTANEPAETPPTGPAGQGTTMPRGGDSSRGTDAGWEPVAGLPRNIQVGDLLFDRFVVERKLGQGGMGDVWLVRHVELEALHALKLIVANIATDSQIRMRFRREARLMANLKHRNAVVIHDARMSGDAVFIDMEYVPGQSLNSLLKPGEPMSLSWVSNVLGQLCDVLQVAHDQGIVHRDLKPTNLMLVDGGPYGREELKVLDFGIAKLITPDETGDDLKTNPGHFLGTPQYSSPEQIDDGHADPRSDLYSVGVILYEFLTGHRPFTGGRILFDHLTMPPPPFAVKNPNARVPPIVERVVMRCLAKEPGDRPQSARELHEEFRRAVRIAEDDPEATESFLRDDRPRGDDDFPVTEMGTGEVLRSGPRFAAAGSSIGTPRPVVKKGITGLLRPVMDPGLATGTLLAEAPGTRREPSSWVRVASIVAALAAVGALVVWWIVGGFPTGVATEPDFVRLWDQRKGYERFRPVAEKGGRGEWPHEIVRKDEEKPGEISAYRLTKWTYPAPDGNPLYLPDRFEADPDSGTGLPSQIVAVRSDLPPGETPMRLILLAGGVYTRGEVETPDDAKRDNGDRPAHRVIVSDFYMQESEVTNGQFIDYLKRYHDRSPDQGPVQWRDYWTELLNEVADEAMARRYPAAGVTRWYAIDFCRRYGGRLPTEAEWEYAARSRGNPRNRYVTGEELPDGPSLNLSTVGESKAQQVMTRPRDRTVEGIFDLTGNLREMCLDVWTTYRNLLEKAQLPLDNPRGPNADDNSLFVIRGGSYSSVPAAGETTFRYNKFKKGEEPEDLGFRLVIEPVPRNKPEKID